ncbi:MAG: DUF421 domain-containing protein [Rhodospirillales bacterium]
MPMPTSPSLPTSSAVLQWLGEGQAIIDGVFGSGAESITWWQTSLRATLIFVYAIIIFRFAYRRMFGQSTDLDIVVAVLVGSALSRAMTGNAHLLPTFAATTLLIILHAVLARLTCRWHLLGRLTKGVEIRLVENGQIKGREMRRAGISEHDLLEAARERGTEDLSRINAAVLERSGRISVILKPEGGG